MLASRFVLALVVFVNTKLFPFVDVFPIRDMFDI
jgi:hypothetical protein